MHFDEHFIQRALPTIISTSHAIPTVLTIHIDSRTIKKNDLFIALPGQKVDGHAYIADALKNGASTIIIDDAKKEFLNAAPPEHLKQICVITVPNTLEAFFQIARTWRNQFSLPVVGITGSVGKTSTKNILANMLSCTKKNYFISHGNQNTQIGLALNMLRLKPEHEAAVFEMGISQRGEMKKLVDLLNPTIGIITNIGHAHMEGLGSLQDIALEKRAIFSAFSEKNIGIVDGDQPLLAATSYPHPIIKFGSKTTNQIQARKVKIIDQTTHFTLQIYQKKHSIVMPKPHYGAVSNALAATAAAHLLELPLSAIIDGIQKTTGVEGRFEQCRLKKGNGTMINDCYNANPESMKAALLALQHIDSPFQKIAIIGDMLELGVNSLFWHRQIGRFLRKVPSLKRVILVGNLVQWTKKTAPLGLPITHVPDWKEAIKHLDEHMNTGSNLVLVKASRGVGLENLVQKYT